MLAISRISTRLFCPGLLQLQVMQHARTLKKFLFQYKEERKSSVWTNLKILVSLVEGYVSLSKALSQYHAQLIFTASSYSGMHWIRKKEHLQASPLPIESLQSITSFTFIVNGENDLEEVKRDALTMYEALKGDENNEHCYLRMEKAAGHFLSLNYTISSGTKKLDGWLTASFSFNITGEETNKTERPSIY